MQYSQIDRFRWIENCKCWICNQVGRFQIMSLHEQHCSSSFNLISSWYYFICRVSRAEQTDISSPDSEIKTMGGDQGPGDCLDWDWIGNFGCWTFLNNDKSSLRCWVTTWLRRLMKKKTWRRMFTRTTTELAWHMVVSDQNEEGEGSGGRGSKWLDIF